MAEKELTSLRVDKWLWATRFFKTRSSAAKACEGGKIKRDGSSLKPSSVIKVGDQLTIPAHEAVYTRAVTVEKIIEKRVSAKLAMETFIEITEEAVISQAREIAKENRLNRFEGDQGRLTKKRRRDWEKITGGFFE